MDVLSYSFAAVYSVELSFSLNDYSSLVTCHLTQGYILLRSFFHSPCFQLILRNKRLTVWKISIPLNFTSLTRNDKKSDL